MAIQKIAFLVEFRAPGRGFSLFKHLHLPLGCILLLTCLALGCSQKKETVSGGIFKTPFQAESQFIVQTVVSDLVEEMFYAKFHHLPKPRRFSVIAKETPGTPLDTAEYILQIRMDSIHAVTKVELDLNRPIWSPEMYRGVAEDLAKAVGLNSENMEQSSGVLLLPDGSAEDLEEENAKLSRALENNFADPGLHERAAVLLGAFALREHSGYFFDLRFPLSRMTAHLAMARFLEGANTYGINGQMANAMLLTLIGDQVLALKQLSSIPTNDFVVTSFVRALQTRNTGDYRTLETSGDLSRIESVEWFSARCQFVDAPSAWLKLNDDQKRTIDFVRTAYQVGYSVEMGHQLLAVAIPLELREIGTVYELSQHQKLKKERLINALNELPERCFSQSDGAIHVRVIGWGQWADFLQHQLCHAIQQDFNLMQNMWGVPEDAKEFAAKCDQSFAELRLYPFVQLMNSTEVKSYHQSMDTCIQLTLTLPHLVPAGCWDWTFHQCSFAPRYPSDFDPHLNEWFVYDPPLGTVYDLSARMNHPTVVDRNDAADYFEKLWALAPYDCRIANFILEKKYNQHATYTQVTDLYSNVLPYSVTAIQMLADTVKGQSDQYCTLMLQAAKLNPVYYYALAQYALDHKNEDQAAQYYDKGCTNDADSVRASYYAEWRVRYYLKKGQTDKAREIADEAGEVYSAVGLKAAGIFQELTGNYDAAFEWYSKIEERYDDDSALVDFCVRYRAKTGSSRFDAKIQERVQKLFPKGIEQVSLNDFHGPPTDGTVFKEQSDLLTLAGLKAGDVIVAVYGIRVHNTAQYTYGRGMRSTPQLDLIVWQGNAYHEITASPPDHLFGVDIGDYTPR